MRKSIIALTLGAGSLLAGCASEAPGTAPVAAAGAPRAAALHGLPPAALRSLPPEAKRQLLAADAGATTLWGLRFSRAWKEQAIHRFNWEDKGARRSYREQPGFNVQKGCPPDPDPYTRDDLGRIVTSSGRPVYHHVDKKCSKKAAFAIEDLGWRSDYTATAADRVQDLTNGKFTYTVPADRMLVLNFVEMPGRVAINGFPLTLDQGENDLTARTLDLVFGPGETIVFAFQNAASYAKPCLLSGYTADPALLGGSLGGMFAESK